MALDYVPVEQLKGQIKNIPDGSLILVVREDLPHKPIWISHVGFVFQKDKTILRHATKLGHQSVKDNQLSWYLKHIMTYKNWKASGLVILKPVEFGPRISRLNAK